MTPPNTLLLVVDSLRADAVFGARPPTPVLDSLARRGVAFEQCVATATSTTPSFASILTGRHLPRHGVRALRGHRLSPAIEMTLPEAFGAAGYHTAAEVTGPLVSETGVFRGFDEVHHRRGHDAPFMGWVGEVTERIRSLRAPWFTLLHVWEAHRPYRSPPDFKKRYARSGYEAAVSALDSELAPVLELAGEDGIVVVTGDHGEVYAESWIGDRVAATVRELRRRLQVGRWAPALERRLAARAIGHGFTLVEELVRVPLIVSGARVPAGAVADQVSHIDLFPTLAELCELPAPALDGRSLVPLMAGEPAAPSPAYMECSNVAGGDVVVGVRTPEWKLVVERGTKSRLYGRNGGESIDERRDLASSHPDVVRELRAFMDEVLAGDADDLKEPYDPAEEAVIEQNLRDLGYL
jgi:arylsulfatase A-like enzyme